MAMNVFYEAVVSALIVAGGAFALVGSWGLIKLPDLVSRLHAPTKATTAGVGGALVGSMIYFWAHEGGLSVHELLITLFLFLTAPITAHLVAKAYLHRHVDPATGLPRGVRDRGWSTFESVSPPERDPAQVPERSDDR
jgi:multicomponent K+:H+ antiporter subunit G